MDSQRNDKGRFVKGNACGVATRFGPGECGNPRGRPRSVDTWLQGMKEAAYTLDELYAVLSDPRAHRNKQDAARVLIVDRFVTEPIPGTTDSQAYRRYRQFYNKSYQALIRIFTDPDDRPDRREGARWRLMVWLYGTVEL